MRLSKGAHLLLPIGVLSNSEAVLIPKTEDGRVLFAIPWIGRLLVGTTEQEVRVDDDLYLTRDEVNYLLRHLNRYLEVPVNVAQVVGGFAGARPLLSSGDSRDTKKLARDHEIELDSQSGLISILGGKWTTHRAMAEDTIDAVQKHLGGPTSPCSTLNHPLIGSAGYSADYWKGLASQSGVPEASARHLAEKFGTCAVGVLELISEDSQLSAPLVEGLAPLRAEVVFSARYEMALTIEDILARRIGLQIYGWSEAIAAAPEVADLLAREHNWPEVEKRRALCEYVEKIRDLQRKAGLPIPLPNAS
jgi:glycerol-3-phosphate dehydrogenase